MTLNKELRYNSESKNRSISMLKVSIIIPVYNAEEYLDECLTGVLKNEGCDFEVIVVDDGSTDKSQQILKHYAKQDSRLKLITKKNTGASDTRNIGIEQAQGTYICFVDADDLVMPNMIETLLNEIGDADVCVGRKIRWNQIKEFSRTDSWESFRGTKEELKKDLRPYRRSMRGATGRLYKKEIIQKYKIRFLEKYNYAEDMHFNYEYFTHVKKVCFADPVVYTYRIHNPDSLSSKNAPFFLKQWEMEIHCIDKAFEDS